MAVQCWVCYQISIRKFCSAGNLISLSHTKGILGQLGVRQAEAGICKPFSVGTARFCKESTYSKNRWKDWYTDNLCTHIMICASLAAGTIVLYYSLP